ncbi:MAG: protease modulator HflC [Alphaproteobacteria bacterium]
MSKNIKRYLIILTILVIILQSSLFTVDQRQQVLILQFGEPIRVINTPGIKFKLPFIQNSVFFEKRIIDLSLPEQEVIASDQKRLIINAYTKFQITDPLKFYTTVGSSFGLSNKLSGILDSSLRQVIGEVNLNELLTENRGDIMKKIKEAVGNSSKIFGIKIIDVRIMRADLPKENSDAIYARMQTEREKEAREIRAKGAEEADRIRAEANKQRTIILAEAKKNADIVRGNGESQANKIYANSLGKDPEFADFYRSMSAYKVALGNNNTKMIISQDNNFFKYFNNTKN